MRCDLRHQGMALGGLYCRWSFYEEIIMSISRKLSIVAVALSSVFAFSAFAADDGGLPKAKPAVTTPKARADVKAERAAAAKDGELNQSSHANPQGDKATVGTKKTRSEVKSETAVAKKADGGTLKTPKN